jgi:hypothetical protein
MDWSEVKGLDNPGFLHGQGLGLGFLGQGYDERKHNMCFFVQQLEGYDIN